MKLVTSLTLLVAALAAAPAARAADDACATDAALQSSLCRADRPHPSINPSPTAPHAGSPVELRAFSAGRGVTFAWDLNGDGEYDDATGAKATTSFTVGTHTVAVRATDEFGRTGTETRTLGVHAFNAAPHGTINLTPQSIRTATGLFPDEVLTIHTEGTDPDGQVVETEIDAETDGGIYDFGWDSGSADTRIVYDTPGTRTIRARFTDDAGATSTASVTLDVHPHAQNLPPNASLTVEPANGQVTLGAPLVAGDARVRSYARDPDGKVAGFDFDLDGNGTYETHANPGDELPPGVPGIASRSFTAGVHEIGVRVTDDDGLATTVRRTVLAVPEWPLTGTHAPPVTLDWAGMIARPNVPVTLGATLAEAGATFAWDTDDDGSFDDGAGQSIQPSFPAEGTYPVRVKATGAGGERIAMATVTVRAAPPLPPVIGPFNLPWAIRPGAQFTLFGGPQPADGGPSDLTISYDLDGDGEFDDVNTGSNVFSGGAPYTIAMKAVDGGGRTALRTEDVAPLEGNLAPSATIVALGGPGSQVGDPEFVAGRPVTLFGAPTDDGGGVSSVWDADGDGDYDDGASFQRAFSAGQQTIGLRTEDVDGAVTTVRQTFGVGTLPPRAGFTQSGSRLTSTSTDPDGGPVTIAWDLDGDRAFDDATGPSANARGSGLVGIQATDAGGDIGIWYANVMVGDPPPPPPATRDGEQRLAKNPLTLTVISGRTPKLKTLLKSALSVTVRCSASCRTTVVASVDKKTAKKLHLRSRNVGRGIGFGAAVRVKLNNDAKRAFKRVKSVRMTLTITAVGSDGLGAAASRTLTLKR